MAILKGYGEYPGKYRLLIALLLLSDYSVIVVLTRHLITHISLHTHAGRTFDNLVTLTLNVLTSESMHVELLSWDICVLSLVLIAHSFFRAWTHTQIMSQKPLIILAMHGYCQC